MQNGGDGSASASWGWEKSHRINQLMNKCVISTIHTTGNNIKHMTKKQIIDLPVQVICLFQRTDSPSWIVEEWECVKVS